MLDVKRLRVLREVAARGSFSGAAESLSYTQSAISQQIAALEREAGTILVERSARGVRLTEAGAALVRHAEAILARLDAAERELEAIAGLRAATAAGFEPRIAFQSNDYTAIQGFIAAGVGVGLIPDLALASVRDDIVIRDIGDQAPSRRIYAASLAGSYRAPATAAMLEILEEVGRDYERGRRKLALAS